MISIGILLIIIMVMFAILISALGHEKEYCKIIQDQERQIKTYEQILFESEEI